MRIRFSIAILVLLLGAAASAEQCLAASCSIISNGVLSFGSLDPFLNTPKTVNTVPDLVINCKGNATITITHNTGLNGTYNLSDGAGHLLPYTFSVNPAPGTYSPPNNTAYPFVGTGTITNYADAWTNNSVAGTAYSDTITFTIVY